MLAKYLNDRLQVLDFSLKLFYVDDLILFENLETLNKATNIINNLYELTGKKLNFDKTELYCANEIVYAEAKQLLGEKITIKKTLNLEYLKCPIGDDEFVKIHLQKKFTELKKTTKIFSEMP